jgi:predicted  nucleic acid-binding Zn-ribbon protein
MTDAIETIRKAKERFEDAKKTKAHLEGELTALRKEAKHLGIELGDLDEAIRKTSSNLDRLRKELEKDVTKIEKILDRSKGS